MAAAATTAPITWVQRLGYILELVDAEKATAGLSEYVRERAREYTMLIPGSDNGASIRSPEWKLVVNAELEPEI